MPLLIRELNIKIDVSPPGNEGEGAGASASGGAGRGSEESAAVKRAVEEMLRIEADRKER